jgi:cytochrome oxidase Cu insertion factor (SCO1/SenC/PrrC family)
MSLIFCDATRTYYACIIRITAQKSQYFRKIVDARTVSFLQPEKSTLQRGMRIAVIAWIISVLGIVGLAIFIGPRFLGHVPQPRATQGEALIGGPFTLVDGTSKEVTNARFQGRYMLVYFGFTHCPDICPTTLLLMMNALEQLGDQGRRVVPVFITLDPERDTPEKISTYVQNFSPNLVGLTGSAAQIKAAADAYKVYYKKVPLEDSELGYVVDHSGFVYLMGPDGKYVTHFAHTTAEQAMVDGLRKHIKE